MLAKRRKNQDPMAVIEPWSRQRLQALLAGAVALVVLLVLGLGYAVVRIVASATEPDQLAIAELADEFPPRPDGVRGEGYRDAVAAAPMLEITEADLRPAAPSLEPAKTLALPGATGTGSGGVPTGYPHTPEGAVAQLASIVTTALGPMDTDAARHVFENWSDPNADYASWPIAQSIQAFHASAGTTNGDPSIETSAIPVAGQIKGTDGDNWVLACVLLDVQISLAKDTRFGFGHCERMQWTGSRWEIATGTTPAVAPSTWPHSQRSLDAGWRTLEQKD
ncbi:MAG: hypothetical protein P1U38_13780 [Aeromicrobium sp.]|uniref:hypothetical protein n=1 Tax=Aeromicrobium sp. TaxID=1871063 RepID=UPI00261B9FFD|nr:hypothetical protein [Aeromicrobium sp.]MDF1705835.1 hypothetical protein [Aeromicrobium sp.]